MVETYWTEYFIQHLALTVPDVLFSSSRGVVRVFYSDLFYGVLRTSSRVKFYLFCGWVFWQANMGPLYAPLYIEFIRSRVLFSFNLWFFSTGFVPA